MLPLILALAAGGCTPSVSEPTESSSTPQPTQPPEPTIVGEPLPGSFYLISEPPRAPYSVTIRIDHVDGPSGRFEQFEAGDVIAMTWSTLPLPQVKWIEVNGEDCQGTFGIQARVETDLRLDLTDDICRVEVLGSHPEGAPHYRSDE